MDKFNKLFLYRKKLILPYLLQLLKVLDVLSYLISVVFILAMVYEHGFRISFEEQQILHRVYDYAWLIFVLNSLFHILFDWPQTRTRYNIVTWVVIVALYSTILPHIFSPHTIGTSEGWWIWRVLSSNLFSVIILTTLSFLQLSMGVVHLLSRRVNPAFILTASFFIFIVIGTSMLMLPRSTVAGISLVDALFMSTSAICVTGLSTVDLATTFTPMGVLFILILIQVGGLGVMTLTSFFAMFFMGNSSLYNQVVVSDMVSSKSLGTLFSTLLYILGFTFIIEAGGAAIIFFDIHGTLGMTLNEEIGFAIFHSISAFCNAGFSTLSGNLGEEVLMSGHNVFYLAITALLILGGIGFPILVNIYETIKYHLNGIYRRYIKGERRRERVVHLYDINTRIVLMMTFMLLVGGTVAIALFEWNSGFASMPTTDKIVHSLFTAACPRTAGFSSVAVSSFSIQTIMIIMVLMIIGGGTQSTAGGIKVNVFAVVMLNLRAIIYGRERVTVFNRELSHDSIRRSNSTLVLYIMVVSLAIFVLSMLEPDVPLRAILFEAISALSTVGSSLDLTPKLCSESKVVITILMFIGRVGLLTMAMSIVRSRKQIKYKYPSGNIIIN